MKPDTKVIVFSLNGPTHVAAVSTLKDLQDLVGGYIEEVPHSLWTPPKASKGGKPVLFCNEDGRSLQLAPHSPPELGLRTYPMHGPCVFVRSDAAGELVSVTKADIKRWVG